MPRLQRIRPFSDQHVWLIHRKKKISNKGAEHVRFCILFITWLGLLYITCTHTEFCRKHNEESKEDTSITSIACVNTIINFTTFSVSEWRKWASSKSAWSTRLAAATLSGTGARLTQRLAGGGNGYQCGLHWGRSSIGYNVTTSTAVSTT